jgi:hypothetical protein
MRRQTVAKISVERREMRWLVAASGHFGMTTVRQGST